MQAILAYGPSEDYVQGSTGYNALHFAASLESPECLYELIQRDWNPCKLTNIGSTAMMIAWSVQVVDALFAVAPELVNAARASDGATPIMHMAMHNRISPMERLIALGCNVNAKDHRGANAAFYASTMRILYALEDANIDLYASDHEGISALHYAAGNGCFNVVYGLIWDYHLDVTKRNAVSGMSPLDYAVKGGHPDISKAILEYATPEDRQDLLLRYASYEPNQPLVFMPIHEAVQANDPLTAQELLRYHAHEQLSSPVGNSIHGHLPVHLAVHELEWSSQVFDVLSHSGADLNAPNASGCTPLYIACRLGMHDVARRLLDLGADPNSTNADGTTPLYASLESLGEDSETVSMLIAAGADTAFVPSGAAFKNVLHLSALYNKPLVMQMLLMQVPGCMVNECCQGDVKGTPLHCAVFGGSLECLELLLVSGADVRIPNADGMTPYEYACTLHDQDVEDGYEWGVHGIMARRLQDLNAC